MLIVSMSRKSCTQVFIIGGENHILQSAGISGSRAALINLLKMRRVVFLGAREHVQ